VGIGSQQCRILPTAQALTAFARPDAPEAVKLGNSAGRSTVKRSAITQFMSTEGIPEGGAPHAAARYRLEKAAKALGIRLIGVTSVATLDPRVA
jgi:hypothetical protein